MTTEVTRRSELAEFCLLYTSTYELDTLALVRLRLTQRAELRSDLAYELLVLSLIHI